MSRLRLTRTVGLALALLLLGAAGARAQQGGEQQLSLAVDSIAVVGNQRLSDAEIVERSQLQAGTTIRYPDIQSAIHSLFATGDFSDVGVRVSRGEPVILYVRVEERPYVFQYEFRGLEHVSSSTVRDTAGLPAEGPLRPAAIRRAISTIQDRLAARGFPRASVDTSLAPMGGDLPGYRFTLHVEEGPRLSVAEIRFEGNEAFTDAELRGALSTGEEGFFWFDAGGFRQDQYEEDLTQNLPDFYASHGYIDMAVVGDTVMVDPETGKGIVEVEVQEGQRYRLGSFEVEGNSRFPAAELRSLYPPAAELEDGAAADSAPPTFDLVGFRSAADEVSSMYRNNGFLRINVATSVEKVPRSDTASGPPMVRAAWNVQEGEPSYIRTVRIVGNTRTHDRIIRDRLTVVPGDVYSQQRLINSIQRIMGMGFFERIPPQEAVSIQNREDGDVDITLRVQEKQTGNLNFGMSAAAISGLAGFIGYEQPNLFGQAKNVNFRWLFGSRTNDINISYSDPAVLGSDYSTNVNLRRSRDEFRTFSVGTRRQTGGSLELGRPIFDRWTRAFVGYSLFEDKTTDLNLTGGRRSFVQTGTRSTGSFRLVRDSRNSNRFPTQGSRNLFSLRHTGGPLRGNGDFSKIRVESEWHVPVAQIGGGLQSNPIQFSGGVTFRGGMVVGDNPFFRERFFLGGVQFGEQLRGYEEATVTPEGHIPRNADFSQLRRAGEAFFTSTAQFGVRVSSQLFLNTFVDAGNVWSRAAAFNPTDLLTGAGVGASLVTPFGPLGIDYAYGFDRRDVLGRPDPGWQLHFKFGRVF